MEIQGFQQAVRAATQSIAPSTQVARVADAESRPSGFADLVKQHLAEVNLDTSNADRAVEQLATGQTDNVHDVVLSMAKADLSFRLVLEVRNRLIESYQEIMRMQV